MNNGIHNLFGFIIEREKRRITKHVEKAQKRGLPASITLAQWLAIVNQFEYSCAYCGGAYESLEHIIPMSWGGGTTADNVVPCCLACNQNHGKVTERIKNTRAKLGAGVML